MSKRSADHIDVETLREIANAPSNFPADVLRDIALDLYGRRVEEEQAKTVVKSNMSPRYRPYGDPHPDVVICNECSTRASVVAIYLNEIAEHNTDAHGEHPHHPEGFCTIASCEYSRNQLH